MRLPWRKPKGSFAIGGVVPADPTRIVNTGCVVLPPGWKTTPDWKREKIAPGVMRCPADPDVPGNRPRMGLPAGRYIEPPAVPYAADPNVFFRP